MPSVLFPSNLKAWKWRRAITINNSSNTNTLTNYQVLVTLDTQSLISAGKMRSDCGDIRFTDSDKSTLLNYWIESGINTTTTKIWVKVPSIPASSSKTIYVYYGNSGATSASNGDVTFDFFDDFPGTSLDTNKWNTYVRSGGASPYVSDSHAVLQGSYLISKNYQVGDGILEYRAITISGTIGEILAFARSSVNSGDVYNSAGTQEAGSADTGVGPNYRHTILVANVVKAYVDSPISKNTYYCYRFILTGVNLTFKRFSNNWQTEEASVSYIDTGGRTSGYLGLAIYQTGTVSKYDYVRVRKYTSPEPTTSVGTTEEKRSSIIPLIL
jgi:hypothetical protein